MYKSALEELGFGRSAVLASEVMLHLNRHIRRKGLTTEEVVELMEITPAEAKDLIKERAGKFTLEQLVDMATAAGFTISIMITR